MVERDGRLYLGEGSLLIVGPDEAPTPDESVAPTEVGDALLAQAVSDLQGRLGAEASAIMVLGVEATEFPDASLGVSEPGESYAQMTVPGLVIRLEASGETYEYHAAGERVVLVPRGNEGASAEKPVDAYQTVTVPPLGLAFEVPSDWQALEPGLVWVPEAGSQLRLGFKARALEPPIELEAALLPSPAQLLGSKPLDLGWAEGRRLTPEVYGPAAQDSDTKAPVESVQTHVLVKVDRGENPVGLDFYASAPSADRLEGLEPVLQHMLDTASVAEVARSVILEVDEARTADWQLFEDGDQGFRYKVPSDWVYEELLTQGPGVPDDWPVLRSVIFYPQAWAQRFEQSGPPDPEASPAIPAVSLEVCVGPMDQFRRVYPEPKSEQELEVNGITVVRESEASSEQAGLIRYVFQNPQNEDVRIVLSDVIGGFADRVEDYPELAVLIAGVVATFEFVE